MLTLSGADIGWVVHAALLLINVNIENFISTKTIGSTDNADVSTKSFFDVIAFCIKKLIDVKKIIIVICKTIAENKTQI